MTLRRPSRSSLTAELAAIGRRFYARGWVLGTSGNFSALTSARPFRLAITPSAAHKGKLTGREFLEVDASGKVVGRRQGRPSAEALLHLEIIKARGASAVLHTHSIWGTILSNLHGSDHGFVVHDYEMLKGLDGVPSHEHREWIPIVANDQDMVRLAAAVRTVLGEHPEAHAFLLRGHGLYTWGATVSDAERHVEILEFLLEVVGRYGDRGRG